MSAADKEPKREAKIVGLGMRFPGDVVLAPCSAEHFRDQYLGKAWRAIQQISREPAGPSVDCQEVARRAGIGGDRLLEIEGQNVFGHHMQLASLGEEIVRDSLTRRGHQVLAAGAADCRDGRGPEVLAQAVHDVQQLLADGITTSVESISDLVDRYGEKCRQRELDPGAQPDVVPTGFVHLDKLLYGGLRRAQTHVIGAATNTGKSALAQAVALNAACSGLPVDFYSLEDESENVLARMLARVAELPNAETQAKRFSTANREPARGGMRKLGALPMWIGSQSPGSAEHFVHVTRRNARLHKTALVVVDYAQRIRGCPGRGIYERMSYASGLLFHLARDTGAAVLVCSQRNANEERNRSLKGAGELAEDAATVMLLEQKRKCLGPRTDTAQPLPVCEIYVTKQKNGPRGWLLLRFDRDLATFWDLAPNDALALKYLDKRAVELPDEIGRGVPDGIN